MTDHIGPIILSFVAIATSQLVNFDSARVGALPKGWTQAMTHEGGEPKWEIVRDESAPSKPNVLAQTSTDNTAGRFPLAVFEEATLKDGFVSVRFKAVSGERDQAAGIVWRYKDRNNYYIVRANALEGNVVLYKVENGTRTSLAPKGTPSKTYGVRKAVPKQAWSSLKVRFTGSLFEVLLGGEKIMEVEDSTFEGPGRIGLWTKADSVTYFDDLEFGSR